MTPVDLTKLLKKYTSGWVAVKNDYTGVVAHADKFIDLQKKSKKQEKCRGCTGFR